MSAATRDLSLLLGLADGSLPEERRPEGEALLADRPDARRAVERHHAVVQVLRAAGPDTPLALQQRLILDTPSPRRRAVPPARPLAFAGAALAVALVALVTGLSWLTGPAPSVLAVANVGLRGIVEPPPPVAKQQPRSLERSFAGVTFPNWGKSLGWSPRGARTDTIDGRETSTLIYGHTHHRLAYTIVSGDPLEPPGNARRIVFRGVELHRLRLADGRDAVTFVRGGRTCVIAGHAMTIRTLYLAAAAF